MPPLGSIFGKRKRKNDFVLSRSLFDQQKGGNELYDLKQGLSPHADQRIYTTFPTSNSFLTDMPLDEKDKQKARKLSQSLTLSPDEAEELYLAKKLGCTLAITEKQIWLEKAAKKARVKTRVFL